MALSHLVHLIGLVITNRGNGPTLKRETIIDVTIASPATASNITYWAVLDELSLSDHFYIRFDVRCSGVKINHQILRKKMNLQELESALLHNRLIIDTSNGRMRYESDL